MIGSVGWEFERGGNGGTGEHALIGRLDWVVDMNFLGFLVRRSLVSSRLVYTAAKQ